MFMRVMADCEAGRPVTGRVEINNAYLSVERRCSKPWRSPQKKVPLGLFNLRSILRPMGRATAHVASCPENLLSRSC